MSYRHTVINVSSENFWLGCQSAPLVIARHSAQIASIYSKEVACILVSPKTAFSLILTAFKESTVELADCKVWLRCTLGWAWTFRLTFQVHQSRTNQERKENKDVQLLTEKPRLNNQPKVFIMFIIANVTIFRLSNIVAIIRKLKAASDGKTPPSFPSTLYHI